MNEKQGFHTSLSYAWKGLSHTFSHERNFRIQLFVAAVVLLASIVLRLSRFEVIAVVFLVFLVLTLELLNTALERFLDILKPRLSYQAEVIKDVMAAIVLVASLGAFSIGVIIFFPYLVEFIHR